MFQYYPNSLVFIKISPPQISFSAEFISNFVTAYDGDGDDILVILKLFVTF